MAALEISALFLKPYPSFREKVPLELEFPFSIHWPMWKAKFSFLERGTAGRAGPQPGFRSTGFPRLSLFP